MFHVNDNKSNDSNTINDNLSTSDNSTNNEIKALHKSAFNIK